MAATIISVSGDKRVQLSAGQMLRRPVILNNWTQIRLAMRCNLPNTANIVGTPIFKFGMGSGTTNGIGDTTTTNFIGSITNQATWTYNAGPPAFSSGVIIQATKKVGTTVTNSAGGMFSWQPSFTQGTLGIFIVDITKGSPNYTIQAAGAASQAAAQTNATQSQLIQMLELPSAGLSSVSSIITGYTVGSQTLAMSEVAGNLDCIQFYWDRSAVQMEITEIFYRKIS